MGFPRATALLGLALLATACGTASAGLLNLGLSLGGMPADCGYVLQVQQGDSCQSLADFAGISITKFVTLNPLALCGILTPAPGAMMCVGDKLAFCSDYYRTVPGDTCSSIPGTLLRIGAGPAIPCSSLVPDTPVCVRPAANKCDVDSLCGMPLSDGLKDMLGMMPDWCTVLSNCQIPRTATTVSGLASMLATVSDITPEIQATYGSEGHPEMRDFVKQRTAGPVQLQIAFTPDAQGEGKHVTSFAFSAGSSGRKLLAVGRPGYYHPSRY